VRKLEAKDTHAKRLAEKSLGVQRKMCPRFSLGGERECRCARVRMPSFLVSTDAM
jgi:hypothetical protein